MKNLFIKLLDLRCVLCHSPLKDSSATPICDSCYEEITICKTLYCEKCGEKLPRNAKCPCSNNESSNIDTFKFVANYEARGKQLVYSLKKHSNAKLLPVYTKLLLKHLDKDIPIMIVPDSIITKYFRGNASLENGLGRLLRNEGFTIVNGLIHKSNFAKKQKLSTAKSRAINAKRNFSHKQNKNLVYDKIQLIDDIYTTGSTINRCALLLKELGYKKVNAITVFRTVLYELRE